MQLIICLLLKQHVLTIHAQSEISQCVNLSVMGAGGSVLQGQLQNQFEGSLCSKGKKWQGL